MKLNEVEILSRADLRRYEGLASVTDPAARMAMIVGLDKMVTKLHNAHQSLQQAHANSREPDPKLIDTAQKIAQQIQYAGAIMKASESFLEAEQGRQLVEITGKETRQNIFRSDGELTLPKTARHFVHAGTCAAFLRLAHESRSQAMTLLRHPSDNKNLTTPTVSPEEVEGQIKVILAGAKQLIMAAQKQAITDCKQVQSIVTQDITFSRREQKRLIREKKEDYLTKDGINTEGLLNDEAKRVRQEIFTESLNSFTMTQPSEKEVQLAHQISSVRDLMQQGGYSSIEIAQKLESLAADLQQLTNSVAVQIIEVDRLQKDVLTIKETSSAVGSKAELNLANEKFRIMGELDRIQEKLNDSGHPNLAKMVSSLEVGNKQQNQQQISVLQQELEKCQNDTDSKAKPLLESAISKFTKLSVQSENLADMRTVIATSGITLESDPLQAMVITHNTTAVGTLATDKEGFERNSKAALFGMEPEGQDHSIMHALVQTYFQDQINASALEVAKKDSDETLISEFYAGFNNHKNTLEKLPLKVFNTINTSIMPQLQQKTDSVHVQDFERNAGKLIGFVNDLMKLDTLPDLESFQKSMEQFHTVFLEAGVSDPFPFIHAIHQDMQKKFSKEQLAEEFKQKFPEPGPQDKVAHEQYTEKLEEYVKQNYKSIYSALVGKNSPCENATQQSRNNIIAAVNRMLPKDDQALREQIAPIIATIKDPELREVLEQHGPKLFRDLVACAVRETSKSVSVHFIGNLQNIMMENLEKSQAQKREEISHDFDIQSLDKNTQERILNTISEKVLRDNDMLSTRDHLQKRSGAQRLGIVISQNLSKKNAPLLQSANQTVAEQQQIARSENATRAIEPPSIKNPESEVRQRSNTVSTQHERSHTSILSRFRAAKPSSESDSALQKKIDKLNDSTSTLRVLSSKKSERKQRAESDPVISPRKTQSTRPELSHDETEISLQWARTTPLGPDDSKKKSEKSTAPSVKK